jgi:hypothetical protein
MIYRRNRLSFLITPVLCLLLLSGIFGLVRLRSSVISIEYRIGSLERHKAEALKQQKVLAAQLAALHSIQEVGNRDIALVFPDRQKVFYVNRDTGGIPYSAALAGGQESFKFSEVTKN